MVIAITFETFQQLYYINRYDINDTVTFFDLLKSQSYKWLIWVILTIPLFFYIRRRANSEEQRLIDFVKLGVFIISLVFLNVLIVSLIQHFQSNDWFSWSLLAQEYIPFFTFQKAPIYTLGYISVCIILYFYFNNIELQFQVQELSELKDNNLELYNELKSQINDKTTILNIKIGNKRKIIPVENILWIEADDYCAKVHLVDGNSYTMRSTLKNLEQKLQNPFLRVHRKAIVNMRMAKELRNGSSLSLILNNDLEVPVSKSNLRAINEYIS
ncbi:LytR/AlgR family response regulator transcription factor [Ulvibacter antarcticus]|uniref:LytTr DNA-binding domain-containing protein n=1 Tax=Ulvibacter antarcticus TaxID=442714 RepID=A0A3L9YG07_9FLAO|nr:LytTR family DNA-binding domain-containing protein [Ulvibacter antarcticus]RMA57035.1 LytTr DNA-binding domain-containing protein [Ulvibacter antarcticus]